MRYKFVLPITALMVVVLLADFATPALVEEYRAQESTAKLGIPELSAGQVWISSIPLGLRAYVTVGSEAEKFVGTTPVVASVKEGPFKVMVEIPVEQLPVTLPSPLTPDFFLDESADTVGDSYKQMEGEIRRTLELQYRLEYPKDKTVIALFHPRNMGLADFERFYPDGTNFALEEFEQLLSDRLGAEDITENNKDIALDRLRRGGIVTLYANGWLTIVVRGPKSFDIVRRR